MQKIRIGLAVIVTGVWVTGYVISFANGSQSPTELTGLMALIVGWATAGEVRDVISKRKDGK